MTQILYIPLSPTEPGSNHHNDWVEPDTAYQCTLHFGPCLDSCLFHTSMLLCFYVCCHQHYNCVLLTSTLPHLLILLLPFLHSAGMPLTCHMRLLTPLTPTVPSIMQSLYSPVDVHHWSLSIIDYFSFVFCLLCILTAYQTLISSSSIHTACFLLCLHITSLAKLNWMTLQCM